MKNLAQGSKTFFSRGKNCISKRYLKVLCIEISISLDSLQTFGGAAGEFKGALDYLP